ncbi:hypothetical protein ARMGADRAFT_1092226 [Armillaria gallica]|uniref:Uncharacterized protein n=1 Tax=Armillaria gallica TaxID=47427 RepID=A0A2H3CBH6_ARMGA|nr:hypothetical protein ARMGADRAFT_1092226 [Armillaria gallica]
MSILSGLKMEIYTSLIGVGRSQARIIHILSYAVSASQREPPPGVSAVSSVSSPCLTSSDYNYLVVSGRTLIALVELPELSVFSLTLPEQFSHHRTHTYYWTFGLEHYFMDLAPYSTLRTHRTYGTR